MNKIANIIKNHFNGIHTKESKRIMSKIKSNLKKMGYSGEIKMKKISYEFMKIMDWEAACKILEINCNQEEVTEDELNLVYKQNVSSLVKKFHETVRENPQQAIKSYSEKKQLLDDAREFVFNKIIKDQGKINKNNGFDEYDLEEA
jgi:hypothetical protein